MIQSFVNHAGSALLDSGLRRAATGILDGLFPTPSTACIHAGVPSRRIQDFLSIAATGILPSRRIQDFLSINDDEEQKSLIACLPLPANARPRPLPSFRRRPESSGFYDRPACAGMTTRTRQFG